MVMETALRPRDGVEDSRVLNQAIRQAIRSVVEKLPREGDNTYEWSFICECGCLAWVQRTTAAFDRDGACKDGHQGARRLGT